MTSAPDFAELAAAHGIELDKDASMLRVGGSDAEYFGAMARDASGAYWMLRAPRRGDVQLAGRQEALVLDFVRGKIPAVVPDWQVHTDKLIAYRVLPGVPAAEIDPLMGELIWRLPQGSAPDAFNESLAAMMAKLHGIDAGAAEAAGIPAVMANEIPARMKLRMDECNALAPVPELLWGLWQKWIDGDGFWPSHVALVNGDIYHPHLFVDADYRVIGVDDWSGAEITDPASDFSLYFAAAGREALEDLLRRYERAGGRTWARMADQAEMYYWASPVRFAAYAMKTGDLSHLMNVRNMVHRYATMLGDSGYAG
ncbi:MAG TPA: macrolide 2'-phosphotransferase [Hyphomonadaceae bacterium]|nr:macrolide 2'-phosphotransferase [Hyphomonadaceae bacterium]HPN04531.1 macrolide 2'-phosphotransferase [Hyphomonadaceae bacterium]